MAARDREKSFVAYFGAGIASAGTVNRPGRAQDTNQVSIYQYFSVGHWLPTILPVLINNML